MLKGKKECKAFGCTNLVRDEKYCLNHREQAENEGADRKEKVGDEFDKIYKTQRWRRVRALQLKKDPLCTKCYKEGKITDATIVDHIKPIREGGEPYSMDNLQSLCPNHHNKKTWMEKKEMNTPREGPGGCVKKNSEL